MTVWANDEHLKARLRQLWAEGHSTAEIGRMMGLSKNAIVGAAHRLDLPGRPSPIRRAGVRREYVPVAARRPLVTLSSLPSVNSPVVVPAPTKAATPFTLARGGQTVPAYVPFPPSPRTPPQHAKAPEKAALREPTPSPTLRECQWPVTSARPWLFCGDPAKLGSSWCPHHYAIVFQRSRDRREDEAA
jgi:GcrA cell cycle regulator